MHSSALINLENFFSVYLKNFENPKILDFGSRSLSDQLGAKVLLKKMNIKHEYTGVDIEKGNNVDIVLKDPYSFREIHDASYDVVISTSVFEHVEFFWLTYLEILRILKPNGILYFNVPSNGNFHRWPKDCWRFYPDSSNALINWAKRNNFNPILLESFVSNQYLECGWNDYVSITLKDESYIDNYNEKIIYTYKKFVNGIDHNNKLYNFSYKSEDHRNWGFRLWYRVRKKIDKLKRS
jgi:SAM-dependent methyltransferase